LGEERACRIPSLDLSPRRHLYLIAKVSVSVETAFYCPVPFTRTKDETVKMGDVAVLGYGEVCCLSLSQFLGVSLGLFHPIGGMGGGRQIIAR